MPMPAPAADARPLGDLETHHEFTARHIGITAEDEGPMLSAIGVASRQALIEAVVPASIRRSDAMRLPPALGEAEALAELKRIAGRNRLLKSCIGQGYHGTHTPGVILRNILENPAWYTAYTPYQAEISQGRMEALLNFQTMVTDLTGMAIANASMLDEATAAAEGMTLALRMGRSKSQRFFVADDVLPQTLEVVRTRAEPLGVEVVVGPMSDAAGAGAFAALLQYPGVTGAVHDLRPVIAGVQAAGGLAIVAADLLALTLLIPPGEMGADIVVGNTQRFGMPMGNGGPHAAYMATRDDFKRSLPGRLVGVSVDVHGQPAYRLALQTREQHIRREKATSNICTAQVLPAVISSMYAVYHGPKGLARIAQRVAAYTTVLAAALRERGAEPVHAQVFDTLELRTGARTDAVMQAAHDAGYNLRRASSASVGITLDETTTREDVAALAALVGTALGAAAETQGVALGDLWARCDAGAPTLLPAALRRTSAYLTHPVFNTHTSETQMLRYIRGLSDKDLALDRTMIPLGSCTMKLNATSEMIPITWPEFANVHPFAPQDQLEGYAELDRQLGDWLCQATGYGGVSLQPNAGSQGEYAGLLVIRAWHASRDEAHRDICLIPESAHGTNPASAQMAGLRVVVTRCDADGNVDLADLQAKCEQHADKLACVMITYPSTYGVFEARVKELCALVHEHGGRVYVDGANMNALVGLAAPGEFGGDVSHLNLHKTFCIPHGGGGPGVGPVCVAPDLVPFLPANAAHPEERRKQAIGAVSGRAARQRGRAADQLDVHAHDGRRGPARRDRDRHPQCQLHRGAHVGPLRTALQRQRGRREWRRCGARMHPRPAPAEGQLGHRRRGRRQAAHRLRLPCTHTELPGGGHVDGRAHRERAARGARPLLRRDDRHPGRDPQSRTRRMAARGQPAEGRAAHRRRPAEGRLAACLFARGRGVSGGGAAAPEVLGAGGAGGQRVRGSQPVLQLRADERVRGMIPDIRSGRGIEAPSRSPFDSSAARTLS